MSGIHKLLKAFGHAGDGWKLGIRERNVKIHVIVAGSVLSASIFFQISGIEWLVVILLIGMVFTAELLNTAIEEVCNVIKAKLKLEYAETTAVRDLAAGAVGMAAVTAAAGGLVIFVPKVLRLLM